jgi:hypothetical protein
MNTVIKIALLVGLGWLPEYAWFDHPTATASPSGKPGGGGLIGTGSMRSGGVRCDHCHVNPVAGPQGHIDAGVQFSPTLVNGQYALGTRYTVTVRMSGEHRRSAAGHSQDGFAGNFELADGGVAGSITSSTPGYAASSCPQTLGTLTGVAGTTITFKDCAYVINRAVQDNTTWVFDWTAPSSNQGDVNFFFGIVDANGNDRTAQADGGKEDDVYMGKLLLRHP